MRIFISTFAIMSMICLSHGRNLASIRKDAFTIGVSKNDSAAEYDFISEITKKIKFSRFRIIVFENANVGQKLLFEGKIDAIISKVNYSPSLEGRFLVSLPYSKTDIAVAVLTKNSNILTLSDLDGKPLLFIPKEVSSEQLLGIWKNSKPNASQTLNDAIGFLQRGEAIAVVASRQSLEAHKDFELRIFPNKLIENNIVALFALDSKDLHEEFNKALSTSPPQSVKVPEKPYDKERIAKILLQVNELKKELELLQKELKFIK